MDFAAGQRVAMSINHNHDFGRRFQEANFRVEGDMGAAQVKFGLLLGYPTGEPDELWITRRGDDWTEVPLSGKWFPHAFIGTMSNVQRFAAGEDETLVTSVEDAWHTMALVEALPVSCKGLDHVEFTADNRYAIATCEFSGQLVKIDLATRKVVGYLVLDPAAWQNFVPGPIRRLFGRRKHRTTGFAALMGVPSMPQDIRSSADGSKFYVADMKLNGVFVVDPYKFERIDFVKTGVGTHGIFPSRDGKLLYITNRGWNTLKAGRHGPGSISVLDPQTDSVVANWPIPGGGSPDMGNVSADGKELWVSGRYDDEVYVFDTETGQLTHRIPVGHEPHGLSVWPQPGRFSLGHTGNMR